MSDMNTNTFGEFVHIDAIVKQFKILTNNLLKLMESKDVELIKFLTRNTNTNKYKPLPVVFVNSFLNVELFKFKFLTRNTNDINVFVDHFVNDFNFKVVGSGGGGAP